MSGIVNNVGAKSGVLGELGSSITHTKTYVLNADFNTTETTITGWIENGNAHHQVGSFGSGVTESSGVFTFNRKGIYLVHGDFVSQHNGADTWTGVSLKFNGSATSDIMADRWGGDEGGNVNSSYSFHHTFNITATTDNIRFHSFSLGTGSHIIGINGWSTQGELGSSVTFTRIRNY